MFAFNKFKSWCTNYNLCALPVSVTTIAVYISYLVQREVLYCAYYGIKWEHDINLFTAIFSEQFIKIILEGSVRILSERTNNLRYIKDYFTEAIPN